MAVTVMVVVLLIVVVLENLTDVLGVCASAGVQDC